ncbi:flagellar basal body rod protein FlgC [Desulfuromonas acetoxidans]|uniref:Flagellar basal-body rod protein FlgC n=1 Tax=Desulfuromonas acetoxidans (strain DSM 684 / 11070) TaxID=281689 RepID=Q1JZU1_DESA6|nr:flagellar basal body rod protein FlgC [Desulfuromonas acetoxidans]EAT15801.1 flagellar basal-body rod protein FlgC [Desulfuromonas acetoxidans DSM 684]MBF0644997.1 flagellar basal body rod protein FlgC [Desulfuromonas acetoxidans]NVD25653.1 flagellar basal body rod protein FlgC [Desulfuromonas acetoxidans]NVE17706.1 flagellar basal body rod protein FlgC [Desulfuromonas acetoxidans]
MDIFTSLNISSSALKAQRIRLDTISSNMANAETTRTPEGGPYRRKMVVFEPAQVSFADHLSAKEKKALNGVQVSQIVTEDSEPRLIFDPSHPDANDQGYVALPNIDLLKETTDMMLATRAYEANITTIKSAKRMALKALEIGK